MKVSPIFCNLLIGVILLMVSGHVRAQSPMTIACNDNSTVSLFFPSKVVKIVSPGVNFKFEYDEGANLGTLQGRKGNDSNLTVITDNGYIFSFVLNFSEKVDKYNYIINSEVAVGKLNQGPVDQNEMVSISNEEGQEPKDYYEPEPKYYDEPEPIIENTPEKPKELPVFQDTMAFSNENDVDQEIDGTFTTESGVPVEFSSEEDDLYEVDREEYYRIFCENNYLQKTIFKRSFRQNKRIVLKLNNILVDRSDIYFVLQIENNSKREYKIDGVSFFRKSAVGQLQKIMKPRYTFNLQESLDPASVNEIVYVFKNFKISSKELIYVALAEKDSNNMVILPLDNKQVNFPSN
ncbi:hypothetical protein [Maribacter luteus]|uniref:hypothetical protein n=1 Tax=Maribacter luteus TaxID=2594478 RepID=UPI0024906646|nr:hypothetical protein [Maribacter luteus]